LSGSWEEGAGSELINESRRTDPKSHWHVMLGHRQIESEPPRTTNRVRHDSQTVPFPFESESLTSPSCNDFSEASNTWPLK
jgi:hypothetical protein